jgi:hypothetical protein
MFRRDSQNGLSLAIVAARAADIRPQTLPAGALCEQRLRNQLREIDQVFAAAKDLHPCQIASSGQCAAAAQVVVSGAGTIGVPRDPPVCEEHRMSSSQGSCLCGGVAFEATGAPLRVQNCHCTRCRKARGTAHATNVLMPLAGVRYLRGQELLVSYKVPDAKWFTHTFCGVCGSSMPRLDEVRGLAVVPMGSFDDDPGFRPERHVFVDFKASWHDITDELPAFPGAPPAM